MIQRLPTKFPTKLPSDLWFDPFLIVIGVLGLIIISALATRRVILAWIATFALIGAVVFETIATHHAPRIGNKEAGVAMQHLLPGGPR